MKGLKLILLSAVIAAMLTSCGTNNSSSKTTASPSATQNTGNVSNTDNGKVSNDVEKAGDAAGNAVKDVGDAAGDIVEGAGDAASDVVEGAGDAAGMNDANNNGK